MKAPVVYVIFSAVYFSLNFLSVSFKTVILNRSSFKKKRIMDEYRYQPIFKVSVSASEKKSGIVRSLQLMQWYKNMLGVRIFITDCQCHGSWASFIQS